MEAATAPARRNDSNRFFRGDEMRLSNNFQLSEAE